MFKGLWQRLTSFFRKKPEVKTEQIQSSYLSSLTYLEEDNILVVTFNNDKTYWYENIPPKLYNALMNASSKGSFFYWSIKLHPDMYPYHELEEEKTLQEQKV